MNQFNLKRKKILLCNKYSFCLIRFLLYIYILNSIKGIVERIEDNDDPKKRSSERASVQLKLPSDKQMKNVKYSIQLCDEDQILHNVLPSELQ